MATHELKAFMSTLAAAALAALSAMMPAQTSADTQRSHGERDTSRHARTRNAPGESDARERADQATQWGRGYRYYNPYGADPATRRFWSPKCVRQRQSGLSPLNHTRDCDNPAYTGGYRPYPRRYPHPYGPRHDRYGVDNGPYRPRMGMPYRPLQAPASIGPRSGHSGR